MPERSDKVKQRYEETEQYELPYISKSRVKQWLENPEHFRLKYLEEIKPSETQAMRRGSDIHETFETLYEYSVENRVYPYPELIEKALPADRRMWADYTEPYITNFIDWEHNRWEASGNQLKYYQPVAVEEEHWRDPVLGLDGEPEWMGLADVILPAAGVPEIDTDEGVVIVDFKTGSVPDEKYRSPGIYTELEYYVMLFEDKYDVVGAGAYYPREHTFLLQPDDEEHREDVLNAAENMVIATREYDGSDKFETKPGPLCKWGPGDDEESALYGVCTQCTWGKPINNENQLRELVKQGYNDYDIAEHFGCEPDAVRYWKYKLDL